VLKSFLTYDHLSVMSGITMAGQLYPLVRDRALNSTDRVRFLKHLRREIKAKLRVIWDGSPIHRKEVRRFMAEGGAKHISLVLSARNTERVCNEERPDIRQSFSLLPNWEDVRDARPSIQVCDQAHARARGAAAAP
jgi:hypothetical protein